MPEIVWTIHYELSIREINIARILMDKGVDIEFPTVLEQIDKILSGGRIGRLDNSTAYHKLFKKVHERNKRITNRYDNLRGGDYLLTVAGIYIDGQTGKEDIKDFSEDTRAIMNELPRFSKRG